VSGADVAPIEETDARNRFATGNPASERPSNMEAGRVDFAQSDVAIATTLRPTSAEVEQRCTTVKVVRNSISS
jgi:hypothetical protein